MSPTDAAKLLDLPSDASPEQLEARFHELRTKLEEKIGKAPTPGLKAKYRESLDEITTAFETLTLAADSSSLPVASKTANVGSPLAATSPSRSAPAPTLHSKSKSGGKEFVLVAVIAVIVLAAGGWFVMKSRAENAEKVRIAAEQKAEAERKAEEARLAAETKKKAEEEEKVRLAAAEKIEQERQIKLLTSLRAELAEMRVTWETAEREERDAERRLSELKSELHSIRDPLPGQLAELAARVEAQQGYFDWLHDHLSRHPARMLRARAEEIVSARASDEAAPIIADLRGALTNLAEELRQQARHRLSITGSLKLDSTPSNLAWTMIDAYGRTYRGNTPAVMTEIGVGSAEIIVNRDGWAPETQRVRITRNGTTEHTVVFAPGSLRLESTPSGATVREGIRELGQTPLILQALPTGPRKYRVSLPGHMPANVTVSVIAGRDTAITAELHSRVNIPDLGLILLPVRAGTFVIGSDAEATRVTISTDYWLGQTEVTQAQWTAIMGTNPSAFIGDDHPVDGVSKEAAQEFCRKLTKRESDNGRLPDGCVFSLPTEAQWEYACRAGSTGDQVGNLLSMGWYAPNCGGKTQPVGRKPANAWGFHDMHGNLWEWCLDWFEKYPGGAVTDYSGPPLVVQYALLRGGSWVNQGNPAGANFRYPEHSHHGGNYTGFRVALVKSK